MHLLERQAERIVLGVAEHGLAHLVALVGEEVADLVLRVGHDPARRELEVHLELLVLVVRQERLAALVVVGVEALQVQLLLLVELELHRRAALVEPHELVVDVLGLDVLLNLHAEVSGRRRALIPSGELRDGCSRLRLHGTDHTGRRHSVRRRRAEANQQGASEHAEAEMRCAVRRIQKINPISTSLARCRALCRCLFGRGGGSQSGPPRKGHEERIGISSTQVAPPFTSVEGKTVLRAESAAVYPRRGGRRVAGAPDGRFVVSRLQRVRRFVD